MPIAKEKHFAPFSTMKISGAECFSRQRRTGWSACAVIIEGGCTGVELFAGPLWLKNNKCFFSLTTFLQNLIYGH